MPQPEPVRAQTAAVAIVARTDDYHSRPSRPRSFWIATALIPVVLALLFIAARL